jgi:hypothetical protein
MGETPRGTSSKVIARPAPQFMDFPRKQGLDARFSRRPLFLALATGILIVTGSMPGCDAGRNKTAGEETNLPTTEGRADKTIEVRVPAGELPRDLSGNAKIINEGGGPVGDRPFPPDVDAATKPSSGSGPEGAPPRDRGGDEKKARDPDAGVAPPVNANKPQ